VIDAAQEDNLSGGVNFCNSNVLLATFIARYTWPYAGDEIQQV
jgi:hypothetical protein